MNRGIRIALGALAAIAAASAFALDTDPGIYGPIDTAKFPHPKVINPRPVLVDRPATRSTGAARPIYLHVPPGHESHWHAHCGSYDACAVPVYFVTEGWFLNVYLPAIGSRDGREQRYRVEAARDRSLERAHHDYGED